MVSSLITSLNFVGASLSEPHTSETALQVACTYVYVCPVRPTIYRMGSLYRIFKLNERIRNLQAKALTVLMDLLNATANHDS